MLPDIEELCNSLSMTDIIRMQTALSSALVRRFERSVALAFSDVVGSTRYFARFGNEAGRRLQQQHLDLLHVAMSGNAGRVVDTAGDGAFLCFEAVDEAASTMMGLLRSVSAENWNRPREHQLAVRIGVHFGPVLTDGSHVTGDSVNLCSRVTDSADPGQIRMTREAFLALESLDLRLNSRMLPPMTLKGIDRQVYLAVLEWRDRHVFPNVLRFENGEEMTLPDQDIICFGRLPEKDGFSANDVVLQCADERETLQISRWHFEIRRRQDGCVIRSVTHAPTSVNGTTISKGEESPLRAGDHIRVGNVLSIAFPPPQLAKDQIGGGQTVVTGGRPSR